MVSPQAAKSRLAYIDWARGLACLLMFQTHCYDSWLSPAARQTRFFMYSQLGGTFPAPLFLFLAGISFALVTEKLRLKSVPPNQIARTTIRRGAEVFAFGVLFRLQEYIVAWGWAPKADLLRVDILNTIGASMMFMGVLCWIVLSLNRRDSEGAQHQLISSVQKKAEGGPSLPRSLRQEPALSERSEPKGWKTVQSAPVVLVLASSATALLISLLTPLLWTTWRPNWLPWPLSTYIDGAHNLGVPQASLFPLFPWAGFAFAGLALGFILQSPWARANEPRMFFSLGLAGSVLIEFSRWLDAQPRQFYPVYDYWHTSPAFFLIRVGMLLVILAGAYIWCRWGAAQWGFSPVIQLGQASLLVYWVHIEFVYGRVSILPKRAMGVGGATAGLLVISFAMLALAYVRTKTKGRGAEVLAWMRPSPART